MKHCIGKLLGALVGFLLAGADIHAWWGAIVGALVCHPFDQYIRKEVSDFNVVAGLMPPGRRQAAYFRALFSGLGYIVQSDQCEFDQKDPFQVLADGLNLEGGQRDKANAFYEEGRSEGFDLVALMEVFKGQCGGNREVYVSFFDVLIDAAALRTNQGPANFVVQEMARQLSVPLIEIDERIRTKSHECEGLGDVDVAWKRLQIEPTQDVAAIDSAYKQQLAARNPDHLLAKGVPAEVVELSMQHVEAINAAYSLLMSEVDPHRKV